MLLHNVSARLRPGGYFIGTTVDKEILLDRLRKESKDGRTIGNSAYKVEFEQDVLHGQIPEFGAKYYFYLEEAIEGDNQKGLPEFLVDKDTLVRLAEEYDLEMPYFMSFMDCRNTMFRDINAPEIVKDRHFYLVEKILTDRKVPELVKKDNMEVVSLYTIFVFKKKEIQPKRHSIEDIIRISSFSTK